jgi:hypothetical protein
MDIKKRALLILAILAAAAGFYTMRPSVRLRVKQEALIAWAQNGAPADFRDDFAHPDYRDAWHDSAAEVVEQMRRVRFAFPALKVTAGEPDIRRDGSSATVVQTLEISGADGLRKAQVTFTWERTGWAPWSWRLRHTAAPELELP